ncbi:MAG: YraN family protein [Phycisphaerales bacterium]|nr:YraN family protein [Phycisphaerales bacterium]
MLTTGPARRLFERVKRRLERLGIRTRRLNATEKLGRHGERAACVHLRRAGYLILGRNLRVPMGEADILAAAPDRRTVVLVEVKSRVVAANRSELQRETEAAVNSDKRQTLRAILRHLIKHNRWYRLPRRIDVIAIDYSPSHEVLELRHHEACVAT